MSWTTWWSALVVIGSVTWRFGGCSSSGAAESSPESSTATMIRATPNPIHPKRSGLHDPAGPGVHAADSSGRSAGSVQRLARRTSGLVDLRPRRSRAAAGSGGCRLRSGSRSRPLPSSRSAVSRGVGPVRGGRHRPSGPVPGPRRSHRSHRVPRGSASQVPNAPAAAQRVVDDVEGGQGCRGRSGGPPAKVETVVAALESTSPVSGDETQAPTGSPPPSALAVVITSGRTGSGTIVSPERSRSSPYRGIWISSRTSRAPVASHASRRGHDQLVRDHVHPGLALDRLQHHRRGAAPRPPARGAPGVVARDGPESRRGRRRSARSWRGPGRRRAKPIVRPWKAPSRTTISGLVRCRGRAACFRTSLIAHSFASVPRVAQERPPPQARPAGQPLRRRSAALGQVEVREVCVRGRPARARPRRPLGWQWPTEQTEIPARKSEVLVCRIRVPEARAPLAALCRTGPAPARRSA